MLRLSFLVLFCIGLTLANARAETGATSPLFRLAQRSEINVTAADDHGAFIVLDKARFERLASWRDFVCTIENFPLGTDGTVNLRVSQFEVIAKSVRSNVLVPAHVLLRGSIDGDPGSHVMLAIFADRTWGYITRGSLKTYLITGVGAMESGDQLVNVSRDTAIAKDFPCSVEQFAKGPIGDQIKAQISHARDLPTTPAASVTDTLIQFPVSMEMDYPYVQHSGGPVAALKYATAVLAAASDIYQRDVGMSFTCISTFVWDSTESYVATTPCELLQEFTGAPERDTVAAIKIMLSGRSMDWCAGVAMQIGSMCDPFQSRCVWGISGTLYKGWAYPYSSFSMDIMVSAHEMGHLVACPHTHSCYWAPPIDSCFASEGGCFDTPVPSHGTIMSYCHTTPAGASLYFHPLCVALMRSTIPNYSCQWVVPVPKVMIGPNRVVQECSNQHVTFTASATDGVGPYTYEVSPAPDSIAFGASSVNITVSPAKASKYYVRITDQNSVRSYDSIIFVPTESFRVKIAESRYGATDSVVLHASIPDSEGVTYSWYKLPTKLQWPFATGIELRVPGATGRYIVRAVGPGRCIALDTINLSPLSVPDARTASFQVYPNPAITRATLFIPGAAHNVRLVDATGRDLSGAITITAAGASTRVDCDLSGLQKGSYWIVSDVGAKAFVRE